MLPRRLLPLAALLWLAAPAALHAQEGAALEPGTRVRVRAPESVERRFTGEVAVPLDAVERLEVSGGKNRVLGALRGAGIGVAGGSLVGATACPVIGNPCTHVEGSGFLAALVGGIAGGGPGVIAGFVAGDERWRTVRLSPGSPVALSPAPGGGVALSVSVAP